MKVQRKESCVLWMWAVWLRLLARDKRRFDTGFDFREIARNGAFDTFF